MHHAFATLQIRDANSAARTVEAIASTSSVDSHGTVIDQRSWKLDRYKKNPVLLTHHDSRSFPVGTADVRVERDALRATLRFSTATAEADRAWALVQEGTLRGLSVGFVPDTIRTEQRGGVEVDVLSGCTLLEISLVAVPSNPDTLIQRSGAAGMARFYGALAACRLAPQHERAIADLYRVNARRAEEMVEQLGGPAGLTVAPAPPVPAHEALEEPIDIGNARTARAFNERRGSRQEDHDSAFRAFRRELMTPEERAFDDELDAHVARPRPTPRSAPAGWRGTTDRARAFEKELSQAEDGGDFAAFMRDLDKDNGPAAA